jgi:pimeloyl-ACP methyl ester carboxylesterase
MELRECAVWGAGSVPAGFWAPVTSDAPVFLVTGSEDYITPPAYAESVASRLPNASTRVVPQRGHDDIDPCVAGLIENYLIQGRDTEPDLGCPEDREPLPFELPD